ncbi:PEP-CTERM sorting domain-containing protein [Sphingomonas carotinifaciens]|uniref:PEP-CTERM protein-sorting domain-containing protein n=1 Tax=Sphingomonas carotinifaciens TaxID=1166323 RepID=A0A1G7RV87_9SPHN|nr:PEP-CTERM sorting domain-containing protein [Sphingomonas carotinifaciens]MBB4088144.1 hypothetical protein [Sphingomonas carotinifaciens]MWC44725.1 PEP-CTERM sorting domain-containing protein [Sphingomonas carotinifaciens]SDG14723.1 PEP-CTERM protein-sorting domain-containing protein [Sphingomonas carotinifaciens]
MKAVFPLLAAAAPAQARAPDLLYALTPEGVTRYRATWRIALNPKPTRVVEGEGFALERVSGTFPRTTEGEACLDFFFATNSGGLSISDADRQLTLATLYGGQLYTGSGAAPTMVRGTFTLISGSSGGHRYTLDVTEVPAVPEPANWALMVAGGGVAGVALLRSPRVMARYA